MAKDLIAKYVWIVDTLTRYGKLPREQLNDLWIKSAQSDGKPLAPRTFYHYRRAIEENFHIDIMCNSAGEYYIDEIGEGNESAITNLLLDSFAINNLLRENQGLNHKIQVEVIPSARQFLSQVMDATKLNQKIIFSYESFNRSRIETDIIFRPYLLKLYKQRWYMIGLKEKDHTIRTYALDRVKKMSSLNQTFIPPSDGALAYEFDNIVGITSTKAEIRTIRIKAERTQAKYLRALPLHHSQREEIHDHYSIFTYQLKLNYELVHEILSFGAAVEVLEPIELKAMVVSELKENLRVYEY